MIISPQFFRVKLCKSLYLHQEPFCVWPQPGDWSLHWLHLLLGRLPHGGSQVRLLRGIQGKICKTCYDTWKVKHKWGKSEFGLVKFYWAQAWTELYTKELWLVTLFRLGAASRVTLMAGAALCWATGRPSTAPGLATQSRCTSTLTPRPRKEQISKWFRPFLKIIRKYRETESKLHSAF